MANTHTLIAIERFKAVLFTDMYEGGVEGGLESVESFSVLEFQNSTMMCFAVYLFSLCCGNGWAL